MTGICSYAAGDVMREKECGERNPDGAGGRNLASKDASEIMKQLRIGELIDSFTGNNAPGQVRSAFASWFLDRRDAEEKERAVEELWDEMSLKRDLYDGGGLLPSAGEVLSDAMAAEKPAEKAELRRWKRLTVIFAVAACLGVVLSTALFLTRDNGVTTVLSTAGAKTCFELPDGSSVWLNRHTTLTYRDGLKGRSRCVSLNGEAYFDIARDEERPFVVNTSDISVKVLGTRFVLSAYDETPESVYLESGKVSLNSPSFTPSVLMPGEAFTFDPVSGRVSQRREKAVNHISWINDRLEFANTPLDEIVVNLEHWYNVKINLSGTVGNMRLTMTVRQEPLPEILDAVSRITGLECSVNGKEICIHDRK